MAKAKKNAAVSIITVEQYRSGICTPVNQKRTLRALGLRRMWKQVQLPDNRAVRGMIATVPHLVRVVPEESVPKSLPKSLKEKAGNGGK